MGRRSLLIAFGFLAGAGVFQLLLWGLWAGLSGPWLVAEGEDVPSVWTLSGPTMGTRYSVSVVGGSGEDADQLRGLIDGGLAAVNRGMSTYDPDSELSRFNASDSTEWVDVSEETSTVIAYALKLAADSGGAYDPTVGPLVNLWGFGPGERDGVPTDDKVAAAGEHVGYKKVEIRATPTAARKADPAVYVDLSSVAKGYGVDAVCEVLNEAGVEAYMVEIGGEVRTRGSKPGGAPWRIGVERADQPLPGASSSQRLQEVVELTDRALATSGDYRNFFEHAGVRYSHTIDPRTGRPVAHDLATVTVLANTCMEADALATALLVLGPTAGYDWASEREIAALFVSRNADEELSERTTPAWDQLTTEAATP